MFASIHDNRSRCPPGIVLLLVVSSICNGVLGLSSTECPPPPSCSVQYCELCDELWVMLNNCHAGTGDETDIACLNPVIEDFPVGEGSEQFLSELNVFFKAWCVPEITFIPGPPTPPPVVPTYEKCFYLKSNLLATSCDAIAPMDDQNALIPRHVLASECGVITCGVSHRNGYIDREICGQCSNPCFMETTSIAITPLCDKVVNYQGVDVVDLASCTSRSCGELCWPACSNFA